jgi:hypothetical protein
MVGQNTMRMGGSERFRTDDIWNWWRRWVNCSGEYAYCHQFVYVFDYYCTWLKSVCLEKWPKLKMNNFWHFFDISWRMEDWNNINSAEGWAQQFDCLTANLWSISNSFQIVFHFHLLRITTKWLPSQVVCPCGEKKCCLEFAQTKTTGVTTTGLKMTREDKIKKVV